MPYAAVGRAVNPVSSIQRITNGTSDSQNNSARFAHSTLPLTRSLTCSMWWWLFQKMPTFT